MSIERNVKDVVQFVKTNQDLIKEIAKSGQSSATVIQGLFNKLEANRETAEGLIASLDKEFQVAAMPSDRNRQQEILQKISQLQDAIETFRDSPSILAALYAELSMHYLALSNTFNDTVGRIVTFTDDEVAEFKVLMRKATLDTQARQRWADILDASVQVTKIALKVATKLAA